MTRKHIAREIDFVDRIVQNHFNDYGEETHRALKEAIKLIEQEPVLDKIIAEIDEKISHYDHFSSSNTANGLSMAKEIVEKYRQEG